MDIKEILQKKKEKSLKYEAGEFKLSKPAQRFVDDFRDRMNIMSFRSVEFRNPLYFFSFEMPHKRFYSIENTHQELRQAMTDFLIEEDIPLKVMWARAKNVDKHDGTYAIRIEFMLEEMF